MHSVVEAQRAVEAAAGAPRRRVEHVALADAAGRVLAADVAIDHDVPPFHRATMDGFAVRASDLPGPAAELQVVGPGHAGAARATPLAPGEAVAIMTGAPVPPGADTVVPVERATALDGPRGAATRVRLPGPVRAGDCVARRGEQVAAGDVVARAGATVTPALVGVLAAAGAARVPVAARPTVSIVCTGDELVPADARPGPAAIRDSNGHALAAQARRAGAVATYLGIVRDDREALRAAFEAGLASDVLLVSGGVSLGDRDLVPEVLAACGVAARFHRWAVKPGGPLWFGVRGETLVFGLPGNPAATFVGFELLVAPALAVRLGRPFAPRATVRASFDGRLPAAGPRRQFVPVRLVAAAAGAPGLVATPVRSLGSGELFALAAADGVAVVPETGAPPPPTCGAPAHGHAPGLASAGPSIVDVVPLADGPVGGRAG
ncbi:MAG: gephyrin-like molybdotransferase Glp [Planctomycetota bacterium]